MTNRTIIVDGDTYVYQMALAAEVDVEWTPDLWTTYAHAGQPKALIKEAIQRLSDELEADKVVLALSDANDNFRFDVLPTYKSGRKKRKKPLLYRTLREFITENYETYERPMLEADDIQGILSTGKVLGQDGEKVICSIDKDLKGIPGFLYNANRPKQGIVSISRQQADYQFLLQTLTGDTTDGYKGCPGVGEVKAKRILDDALNEFNAPPHGASKDDFASYAWRFVVQAFEHAGLSEVEALQQARVARILRSTDYNFKDKEPKLWTPSYYT